MKRVPRRSASAVVALVLLTSACGGGGGSDDAGETTSTTVVPGCNAQRPVDPILPVDVNPIPYQVTDNVALGDWKIRVKKVEDPSTDGPAPAKGSRNVALDLELENGSLKPQQVRPEAFFLYDTRGCGATPVSTETTPPIDQPLPSTAVATARMVFEVRTDREPSALVFRGPEFYGPKVLSGLIALSPDYRPPEASS